MNLRWMVRHLSFAYLLLGYAFGLDPSLALTQYGHTAWRVRDGYFSAPPLAIAQTVDGQLWIGGEAGLLRFDGVQFSSWKPPEGHHLPDERIYALLGASDGSLWIGTGSGIARWKNNDLVVYATAGRFSSLLEDQRGSIWAGHTRALGIVPPLCHFAESEFKCFAFSTTPGLDWIGALKEDLSGDIWIGSDGAVCRWGNGKSDCYALPTRNTPGTPAGVQCIAVSSDGAIWLDGGVTGIWQLKSDHWRHFDEFPKLKLGLRSALADREGAVWLGDRNHGLIRQIEGRAEEFDRTDGLSSDTVTAMFEDREGSVWVATSAGLDRFRDVKVATITPREGLPISAVGSILASRDGSLWIGGGSNLVHATVGKAATYKLIPALPLVGNLGATLEDSRGRLWVGIGNFLVWRENGRFHRVSSLKLHQSGQRIRAITEDVHGVMWAASTDPAFALVRIDGGRVLEQFTYRQVGDQVSAMAPDPAGGVWLSLGVSPGLILARDGRLELHTSSFPGSAGNMFMDAQGLWASTRKGLVSFRNGVLNILNAKNDLPCDDFDAAIKDDSGALWLKGTCGLIQIPASELELWLSDPDRRVRYRYLDAFDGTQAGGTSFGRVAKTPDGRIWFALEEIGIQVVDPKHLEDNPMPPPIAVTGVVSNHQAYGFNSQLHLPALTRNLEIDYTAYSLKIPEKVRFRYRLEGVDTNWQAVGGRREAYFANLKPGAYRFDVSAANNDGVWNEQGAALDFTIAPAFYQTRSFLLLCVVAGVGFAWAIYMWRVRILTGRLSMQFRERLAERTHIAQELHDTLLQGVISASMHLQVANDQLASGTPAKPLVMRVIDLMGRVIDDGRNALHGLRFPSDVCQDLSQAFSRVPQELGLQGATDFRVIVEGPVRDLHPIISDEMYRIGREAITNAFRHSRATRIEVALEYGAHELRLVVRDNGCGIDPRLLQLGRQGHWGLPGMRERAEQIGAKLKLSSGTTAGTEVVLRVPGRIAFKALPFGKTPRWLAKIRGRDKIPSRVKREKQTE